MDDILILHLTIVVGPAFMNYLIEKLTGNEIIAKLIVDSIIENIVSICKLMVVLFEF